MYKIYKLLFEGTLFDYFWDIICIWDIFGTTLRVTLIVT